MGCRVISNRLGIVAQPVFPEVPGDHEPRPLFPRHASTEQGPAPAIGELRRRIVELETMLSVEVQKAKDAGRREGETAGLERARAELAPVVERMSRGISELATLRARIRHESEGDLVKLSLCIARRVLRRELTVDPDAVLGLVKAALDKVQSKDLRRVRVHPDFQTTLRRHIEVTGLSVGAEIVGDASLQPGDVIVETRLGDLDGTIESQLNEIDRGFADRLNR